RARASPRPSPRTDRPWSRRAARRARSAPWRRPPAGRSPDRPRRRRAAGPRGFRNSRSSSRSSVTLASVRLYRVGKIADKALTPHAFRLRRRAPCVGGAGARGWRPGLARGDVLVEESALSAILAFPQQQGIYSRNTGNRDFRLLALAGGA